MSNSGDASRLSGLICLMEALMQISAKVMSLAGEHRAVAQTESELQTCEATGGRSQSRRLM